MRTRSAIQAVAQEIGGLEETIEQVLLLLDILRALTEHERTRDRWVLKGGTALNLFHLALPRLSVDIDINFTGVVDVAELPPARAEFEKALALCFARAGCQVKHSPTEHAGGKFRLSYASVLGGPSRLEVDVAYTARVPILGIERRGPTIEALRGGFEVPSLSLEELAAGKFCALVSRGAARDYFDAATLLEVHPALLESSRFRLAFLALAGGSRDDFRTLTAPPPLAGHDVTGRLRNVLRVQRGQPPVDLDALRHRITDTATRAAQRVLEWSPAEREFLDRLNERGEVVAELLTDDAQLQERVRRQPMLAWKAQNVRKHRAK